MPKDNPKIANAKGPDSGYEILFPQREKFSPHKASGAHPASKANDDHNIVDACREKGDYSEDQEKAREAKHDIYDSHD